MEPLTITEKPIHKSTFIGSLHLQEFKQLLESKDVQAKFVGSGVLSCNRTVKLKKAEDGTIQLSGRIGPDYFRVRDELYKKHAIV